PKEFQKQLFARASKNVNFADGLAQGLGFGIGFCFKYLDQVLKGEVFQRAEEDSAFAYGLAYGLWKTFRFRPIELQNELFLRIEESSTCKGSRRWDGILIYLSM